MTTDSRLKQFLSEFQAGDLLTAANKIVWVTRDQKCDAVLRLLTEKRIQSVPVWDEASRSFIGLVDVLDLLALLVIMNTAKEFADAITQQVISWDDFNQQENSLFNNQTVGEICNASSRNPWCPVFDGLPLGSLMDMFGRETNLHRVPVVDGEGEVLGLITQSRVIEFLATKVVGPSGVGETRIDSWYQPKASLVTVNINSNTLIAYRTLLENSVSGIAVVDNDGKMVDSLSASDIKVSLGPSIFSDINLPLDQYLQKSNQYFQRHGIPITCEMSDTTADVLERLNSNHIHRLFIVDQGKPVGVISLCDIISYLNQSFRGDDVTQQS